MICHNSEFDFRRQECTKIRSKIASKMAWLKFAAKTLQDVSKTLIRRPKKLSDLPQNAPPDALRCLQGAPRRPQDDPKTPQDAPKTAQEPQEHPKSKFNRFFALFRPTQGGTPSDGPMGYPPLPSIFSVQPASPNLLSKKVII